jgi:hypothetical protein
VAVAQELMGQDINPERSDVKRILRVAAEVLEMVGRKSKSAASPTS